MFVTHCLIDPIIRCCLLLFVFIVGGLAMDHMAGLTFGGHPPHSATEHVQDPNVLVLHSVKVQ